MLRSRRSGTNIVCAAALGVAGVAGAQAPVEPIGDPTWPLSGIRVVTDEGGAVAAYGAPMISAEIAEEAAAVWLRDYAETLGAAVPDLRLKRSVTLASGHATVFVYRQYLENVPVEYGHARLFVRRGWVNDVVFASGRMARLPKGGFPADRVTADQAIRVVQGMNEYAGLTEWSAPSLAVVQEESLLPRRTAVKTWKFTGVRPDLADFDAYTFFVSDADGSLVHARREVYNGAEDSIFGNVSGVGSPGLDPDNGANRSPQPLVGLQLRNQFGFEALTDENGDYVMPNNGAGPTQIEAKFLGPWVTVVDTAGPTLTSIFQPGTPPGPLDFLFNPTPNEFSVAQVNAFTHTSLTHDFYRNRAPDFVDLDISLEANVNIEALCNAFFTPIGPSINFFISGLNCVNSSYSTVVAHEYGHFIVSELELRQGAFGEGFGDCISILQYDDPIIGRDFSGPGMPVRDIVDARKRYPCFDEVHECGQVLAGVWWDIKEELQDSLGDGPGLELARQLFVDWSQLTAGGSIRNSAHPLTAIEVLTVDDDDGDLNNGTPNSEDICRAFVAHNINCPGTCEDIRRTRVTCNESFVTPGQYTLRATAVSGGGRSSVTFVLDGAESLTINVGRLGRGTAVWRELPGGEHEVCIDGCDGFCRAVTCEPRE